jgi:hypothetical protein
MPLTAGEWSPKVVTTTERFFFTESLGDLACGVESSNAVLQKVHLCGLMGTYKCFVLIIYPFLQPSSTIRFKLFWDSYCIRCLRQMTGPKGFYLHTKSFIVHSFPAFYGIRSFVFIIASSLDLILI